MEELQEMNMKCPECNKEVHFKPVDKMGQIVGYRLEKLPQPIDFCDFKEYNEPEYCVACGHNLTQRNGVKVCEKCEIKYEYKTTGVSDTQGQQS